MSVRAKLMGVLHVLGDRDALSPDSGKSRACVMRWCLCAVIVAVLFVSERLFFASAKQVYGPGLD